MSSSDKSRDEPPRFEGARQGGADLLRFLRYTLGRFAADSCPQAAAALSYSSLLAMVPLLAIGIAVLSSFPAMEALRFEVQQLLFQNLLPDTGVEISDQLAAFLENAQRMTGPGLAGLAVTALLLLSTISTSFQRIWRVRRQRSLIGRILVYWAVLTLGPLLVAASLSITRFGQEAVTASGLEDVTGPLFNLASAFKLLLSTAGFSLLYLVLPGRTVRLRHALAGGLATAILLALLGRAFGLYVTHFPSYQAVYGAIAAVPIFLVWMYLSWAVILLGAEIVAALPEWQFAQRGGRRSMGPGPRLALALVVLQRLRAAARSGAVAREVELARGLPISLEELSDVLDRLERAGYVTAAGAGRWVLSRDLSSADLHGLMAALKADLAPGAGWPPPIGQLVGELAAARDASANTSLAELLDRLARVEELRFARSS